jgi:hypothetical protein
MIFMRQWSLRKWITTSIAGLIILSVIGSGLWYVIQTFVIESKRPETPVLPPIIVKLDTPLKIYDTWIVYPATGMDAERLFVKFLFTTLDFQYYWAQGSPNAIEREVAGATKGVPVPVEELIVHLRSAFKSYINLAEKTYALERTPDIITVGLASEEGARIEIETERGLQRAITLAKWIREYQIYSGKIWTLNLGRFRGKKIVNQPSRLQRPVLFIYVLEKDEKVNLGQALVNAMSKQRRFPHPENYSQWDLAPF